MYWLESPSHAWLVVPLDRVYASGCAISQCSYSSCNVAYLEEDCDAGAYLDAAGISRSVVSTLPVRFGTPKGKRFP